MTRIRPSGPLRRSVQPLLDRIDRIAAGHAREQVDRLRDDLEARLESIDRRVQALEARHHDLDDVRTDLEILRSRLG